MLKGGGGCGVVFMVKVDKAVPVVGDILLTLPF